MILKGLINKMVDIVMFSRNPLKSGQVILKKSWNQLQIQETLLSRNPLKSGQVILNRTDDVNIYQINRVAIP